MRDAPGPLKSSAKAASLLFSAVRQVFDLRLVDVIRPGEPQLMLEPVGQLLRRVVPARAQQLIAGRDLDQDREVASWRNRHADERKRQIQDVIPLFAQAEPVVVAPRLPPFEL